MLTEEQTVTARGPVVEPPTGRWWARGACWLGLLGVVLSVAVPFLPVVQHETTIVWPSPSTGTAEVNAPLVALRPESMTVSMPCAAVASLDARSPGPATVFSTVPPESPDGERSGLSLTVSAGTVALIDRGQQLVTAPVPNPVRDSGCAVSLSSNAVVTTVDAGAGVQTFAGDQRPQVVGVYSDLDDRQDPMAGAAVRIDPDTRFDTTPTTGKLLAAVGAVVCVVGALVALAGLDRRWGRRPHRPSRPDGARGAGGVGVVGVARWWSRGRPRLRDAVVAAVLFVWMAIGGQTSDDGFTLGIVRDVASSGYVGNYYRWYHAAEAPFGWFYDLYALWVGVSDSLLWLRLPGTLMGLVAWWLVSRGLLPRLGRQVRRSQAATWAAAAVFLAFWMAYDSGLRPEPVVVVFSLVALVCVERAVALGRLFPVGLGLMAATLAIGANPAGLIAVAPFLAAARPLWALLRARIRVLGGVAVLAPLGVAGTVILVVVFADQSWAAVVESTRLRSMIGPNWQWFTELAIRYGPLFSESADGSVARRFPILLLMLCLTACAAVYVRRGRIPGAALGPARRLIATTGLSFVIFALTPTKWTHHFGDLVGLGAAVAALAAVATGADVVRSLRNRLLFLAAVFAVAALSFAGPNTWWYTNNWGVPWYDKAPSVSGYQASTALLGITTILAVAALVEHLRGPRDHHDRDHHDRDRHGLARRMVERLPIPGGRPPHSPHRDRNRDQNQDSGAPARRGRRALRLVSAPLALLCGLLVAFNLASMAKAVDKQSGSWSMGADALTHPLGGSCGLSSRVFAEDRPVDGVLMPTAEPTGMAPPPRPGLLPLIAPGPDSTAPPPAAAPAVLPPGVQPPTSPAAELVVPTAGASGFRRDGVPPTGGGTGVSGFEYVLTGGLGSDAAPAYGSFDPDGQSTGTLRTPWAQTTEPQRRGATPMVVTAAGNLGGGNRLTIQYATRLPDGRVQIVDQATLDDGRRDEAPWRELRFNMPTSARSATEARLVAQDTSLGRDGWLAIAPLRAPQLAPLSQVVDNQPMFLEYPVSLASPCLRPFTTSGGIAQLPAYRLQADDSRMRADGENWSSPQAGGPLGWIKVIARQTEVPTYLDGDPQRDWGRVHAITPYRPDAVTPTLQKRDVVRPGTAATGPLPDPPPGVASPER